MKQGNVVDKVTKESMDGSSELEKEINAYLTKRFILTSGVPSDECLNEAVELIKLFQEYGWTCQTSRN